MFNDESIVHLVVFLVVVVDVGDAQQAYPEAEIGHYVEKTVGNVFAQ